jgi:hypothetical protein
LLSLPLVRHTVGIHSTPSGVLAPFGGVGRLRSHFVARKVAELRVYSKSLASDYRRMS